MKPKSLLLIALLALILLATLPASAQTITMSNPSGIAERDIIVYFPNGSMQGFYNSTSVITLDPNTSYIFSMKPMHTNPLEDPTDWMANDFFPFLQTNATALFVGFGIIGYFLLRGK